MGLLALGDGAVISHRAAATLHRFDRCQPDIVEFTVPRASRHATLPFPVHSTMTLPRIDRVVVEDYPCTSATRTIIDLARLRVGTLRVEAAIDTAVRTGRSSPVVIVVEVSGRKGHTSPSERARDAQRRNELQDVGRRVYEYTWEHVIRDGDMVIDTMRSRLGSGSLNRSP